MDIQKILNEEIETIKTQDEESFRRSVRHKLGDLAKIQYEIARLNSQADQVKKELKAMSFEPLKIEL